MAWLIDTRDFNALSRALKDTKPELRKELRASLKRAGEITAAAARAKASEHSRSIPPTVKTHVRGTAIEITAGTVIGGLYEYGNKGSATRNTFRHPVFGTDVWVEEKRYPFMRPAVMETERAVENAFLKAMDAAMKRAVEF